MCVPPPGPPFLAYNKHAHTRARARACSSSSSRIRCTFGFDRGQPRLLLPRLFGKFVLPKACNPLQRGRLIEQKVLHASAVVALQLDEAHACDAPACAKTPL